MFWSLIFKIFGFTCKFLTSSLFLKTYERACIKKWLEAGHGTCPKTQQIISSAILTPNYVLSSLISTWCEVNGMETPKQSGNSNQRWVVNAGSIEIVELEALLSKLTSDNIEDQRTAAGERYKSLNIMGFSSRFLRWKNGLLLSATFADTCLLFL